MIKNMFCIFCAFCMLCLPSASETAYKKYYVQNGYSKEDQAISTINISNINNAFKSSALYSQKNDCDYAQTLCIKKGEFETIKIAKGTKFHVKSKQDISNYANSGTKIIFESVYPEKVIPNGTASKLIFKGKITKTRKPQLAGNGGLVKIEVEKMTLGNITYPITGLITQINNKPIFFNNIKSDSAYITNTVETASIKNGVLSKLYKDPCGIICQDSNPITSPLYLLGGALVQTSNLVLSPVGALFKAGNNLYIKNNSDFVIKLDEDVFVLKI